MMKVIENQTFDMERALYGSNNILVRNCNFDGRWGKCIKRMQQH